MPTLLIVDDEQNVLYSLEKGLRTATRDIITARTAQQAIELVRQRKPDAVLLDVRLPDMSGLEAFDEIHQIDPRLPVVIITAFAATETAIEAMKRGAFEYLLKPIDLRHVRDVVERAIELSHLTHVPALFEDAEAVDTVADRIVGHCAAMQEVYKAIGRVAESDVSVLVLGESGTGKELVARAIFHHSRRSNKPFLAFNCAAIPDTLLESELFGHERGSFTGADRRRIGKFEQASGGTLFLDEIGDMSLASQGKVLRVLQDQRFERVGGNETIQTDVRLIAATNQNLDELVESGRFRRDLYHRLKVFTIQLPPLRERIEDLPLLINHFIRLYNREMSKQVRAVSPDTLRVLESYGWPGNVRELQSTIKFALVNARAELITVDCLPESCRSKAAISPASTTSGHGFDVEDLVVAMLRGGQDEIYRKVQFAVDRVVLQQVLRHVHGNQVEASRVLGISRTTLRAKLQALGMSVEKQLLPESAQSGQLLDSRADQTLNNP
jgi:two-component system nitrogen regulation response regulator GlnG